MERKEFSVTWEFCPNLKKCIHCRAYSLGRVYEEIIVDGLEQKKGFAVRQHHLWQSHDNTSLHIDACTSENLIILLV